MSVSLVLAAVLAAGAPQGVAVMKLRLAGVTPEVGGYVEDRLAKELRARGFDVSSPADLEAVLGLERQRQLLGCSDDTTCIAEIGAALGVEFAAVGRLTRLGSRLEIDVRLLRQRDAKSAATASRSVRDDSEIPEALVELAADLTKQLRPDAVTPARPFAARLWVPVILGVVSLGAGGVLLGTAEAEYAARTTTGSATPIPADQISSTFQRLQLQRGLGFGFIGLGAALVVTGIVWNALVPTAPVQLGLMPTRDGAAFSFGGAF